MTARIYRKHFIPLESNPDVFNSLIHRLGSPPTLAFQDVWSLDDEASLPQSALALVFVFHEGDDYKERKAGEAEEAADRSSSPTDDILWFRQTINNACGLYAILHALCNGKARELLVPGSLVAEIYETCAARPPGERPPVLEDSDDLERAYAAVATQGTSAVPDNPEDEVDFHYVCFVKAPVSGRLYELDGMRTGPVDTGIVLGAGEDVLSPRGLQVVRDYIQNGQQSIGFSLMALVHEG